MNALNAFNHTQNNSHDAIKRRERALHLVEGGEGDRDRGGESSHHVQLFLQPLTVFLGQAILRVLKRGEIHERHDRHGKLSRRHGQLGVAHLI